MPDVDSVVVVGFDDNSKAYEGLTVLKSLSDQQQLTARSAAVVERDQSGTLQVKESLMPLRVWQPSGAGLWACSLG